MLEKYILLHPHLDIDFPMSVLELIPTPRTQRNSRFNERFKSDQFNLLENSG
jgi:hypothetical protein